ncbi:MAG: hypothetical protein KBB01_04800 [Candidatus Omnitrophica bacterium]|jgi:hypothetical protein|nr:hypothetical protein [Candidatus Omnitrophota bacterium]
MQKFSRYDLASFAFLAFLTIFSLARHGYLPQFIDGYYHLSVANGFIQSGGWVGWDWWSFAPFGRPHLYPPLYHLILVLLQKLGLSGITALRISEVAIVPLFFFVFWFVSRSLLNDRFSFINLLALSGFFSFYSSVTANVPASLALIWGFLSWYWLKKKRVIKSIIFLTLTFYTHSAISWVFWISFLFILAFDQEFRHTALKTLLISLALAAPFLWHQLRYFRYLDIQVLGEAGFTHFNIFIFLSGLVFLAFFYRRSLFVLLFLGYLIGSLIVFFRYPYRFFSAQGIVGFTFFASLLWDKVLNPSQKSPGFKCSIVISAQEGARNFSSWGSTYLKSGYKKVILALVIIYLLFFQVTLDLDKEKSNFNIINSTCYNLLSGKCYQLFEFRTFYYPEFYDPLVWLIRENTAEGDIIFSNIRIAAQIFSALSGRPTSSPMLWEVKAAKDFEYHKYAKLIIWLKPSPSEKILSQNKIRWEKIYEDNLSCVYLNLDYQPPIKKLKSKLNFPLLALIFFILLVIHIRDSIFIKKKRD